MPLKLLIFIFSFALLFSNEKELKTAKLYYEKSTKEESYIEKSEELFLKYKNNPSYKAVVTTYLGSLEILKAKYTFWPQNAIKHLKSGHSLMEEGLALEPNNIESLFVFGATLWHLPSIIGKKDEGVEKLKSIVKILNDNTFASVKPKMMKEILTFIDKNIELNDSENTKVKYYLNKLEDTI